MKNFGVRSGQRALSVDVVDSNGANTTRAATVAVRQGDAWARRVSATSGASHA